MGSSETIKGKTREPNLLSSERETLLNIIEDHIHITDCKKTDGVTVERKIKEWEKISEKFNGLSAVYYRDALFLKQSWENIKKRAKKEATQRKIQLFKTGGGPFKKPKEDPGDDRILGLIEATTSGFNNNYDGDSCFLTSPFKSNAKILNPSALNDSATQSSENADKGDNESETQRDWSKYTLKMLREPISNALKVNTTYEEEFGDCRPSDEIENSLQLTPQTVRKTSNFSENRVSRRRPTLEGKNIETPVNETRRKNLEILAEMAKKEHEIMMNNIKEKHNFKILILKERLAQEKLKTRLLEIEMHEKCEKSSSKWLDPNI